MENIVININSLKLNIKDVKEIVNLIAEISEQTNLLSLNASIEAAKAGSHGKSFSVVAEEIKKLAVKSKESSIKITEIINNIEVRNEIVTKEITNFNNISKEEKKAIDEVNCTFNSLFEMMNEIDNQLGDIVMSIGRIGESKINVEFIMKNILSISK